MRKGKFDSTLFILYVYKKGKVMEVLRYTGRFQEKMGNRTTGEIRCSKELS